MQVKRVLVVGCLLLVVIQLCLADIEDDKRRQHIEQSRRRRKEELRAMRRQQRMLDRRGKRNRDAQERLQHLEAGQTQFQGPQDLAQQDRPLRRRNELQRQQRNERRNQTGDARKGGHRRRLANRNTLRSNELNDHKHRNNTKPNYVCPPDFVRLGNSCYMLSKQMLSWQDAHHYCRDVNSHLASLESLWEDENIRNYLNRKELARLERWIGGRFNWENKKWIWGSSGKRMGYQGFSRRNPNDDRTWHCVFMDPVRQYRWAHKSCFSPMHFVCEAPLQQMENLPKDLNEI